MYRETETGPVADGLPAQIALSAAGHGGVVQLVGKAGEDEAGDAVVLALARGGVGHVALIREAGRPTPRADAQNDAPDAEGELGAEPLAREPRVDSEPGVAARAAGRVPAPAEATLEAADVDLALRYLTDLGVIVLAEPAGADVVRVITAAANWSDARVIVVVPAGESAPEGLPPDAIVFEAPDADPDNAFATMLGSFAAALDNGGDPGEAFRSSVDSGGWTAAPED